MESWKIIEMLSELDPNEEVISINIIDDGELEITNENGETSYLLAMF